MDSYIHGFDDGQRTQDGPVLHCVVDDTYESISIADFFPPNRRDGGFLPISSRQIDDDLRRRARERRSEPAKEDG